MTSLTIREREALRKAGFVYLRGGWISADEITLAASVSLSVQAAAPQVTAILNARKKRKRK